MESPPCMHLGERNLAHQESSHSVDAVRLSACLHIVISSMQSKEEKDALCAAAGGDPDAAGA